MVIFDKSIYVCYVLCVMNRNFRFLIANKKYLVTCLLSLFMAGRMVGQSQNDSIPVGHTLTHQNPISLTPKPKPKNPKVKFGHVQDILYIELESFTHATTDNIRTVFSPLVVVSPFVRFNDKFTVQFTTTQMIQNYTTTTMTPLTHDMYMTMELWTRVGKFNIKVGNFSPLNYSAKFSKDMPVGTFFINALYMNSGSYFPRAVIGTFENDEHTISLGYMEQTPGFQFTGHGYVVLSVQERIENVQFGGVMATNNKETFGNLQLIYMPTTNDAILLQAINLGVHNAMHATYRHTFRDDQASIAVNAFKEQGDGITGANVALFLKKVGAYAAIGATKHNPLYLTNPESPLYEHYDKWTPYGEIGVAYGIKPKSR